MRVPLRIVQPSALHEFDGNLPLEGGTWAGRKVGNLLGMTGKGTGRLLQFMQSAPIREPGTTKSEPTKYKSQDPGQDKDIWYDAQSEWDLKSGWETFEDPESGETKYRHQESGLIQSKVPHDCTEEDDLWDLLGRSWERNEVKKVIQSLRDRGELC